MNHTDIQWALAVTKKRFYQDCSVIVAMLGITSYECYAMTSSQHSLVGLIFGTSVAICCGIFLPGYLESIRKCWKSWKDFEREKKSLEDKVDTLRRSLLKKNP